MIQRVDAKESTPLVSIISLNFNGLKDTVHCVQSLLSDGCSNREIIIWDNGSKNQEAAQLEQQFGEKIRVIASPTNLGVAAGYNAAEKLAKGKYLVFLNNDTEVTPGWLDALVAHMEANPNTAACQPKVRSFFDRDSFDYAGACGGFLDRFGYPFMRGRVFFTGEKDEGQYDGTSPILWASAACMLVRRSYWQEVGGVDEKFFMYMDEVDLCWQFRRKGYDIVTVADGMIYHMGAQGLKNFPYRKRFLEHRNNLLMLIKNITPLQFLTLLLPRLVLEWVSFFYYLATGRFPQARAVVGAFFAFLWMAPGYIVRRSWKGSMPLLPGSIIWGYFICGKRTFSAMPGVDALLRRLNQ